MEGYAWARRRRLWQGLAIFYCAAWANDNSSAQTRSGPSPTRAELEFGLMEPVLMTPPRFSSFIGYDAGPSTSFFSAGMKFAPTGDLYHSGPLVMIAGGAGILPIGGFRASASAVLNQQTKLLAGYQFVSQTTTLSVLVGQSMSFQQQVWFDGRVQRGGFGFGPAIHAELWSKPVPGVLMTAVYAYTGGDGFSWMRLHIGRRLYGYTYAGPEFSLSTNGDYRQTRLGLRLTGLNFGVFAFDASIGAARDSKGAGGLYVSVTAYQSF